MLVSFDLKNCYECKHKDHTGGFSQGGSKSVCDHPNAKESATKRGVSKRLFLSGKSIWLKDIDKKIPNWCPLHHGFKYQ